MNIDPDQAILAVDIGGTKIAAGLVDGEGRVHHRREVATAADHADAIAARAVSACRAVLQDIGPIAPNAGLSRIGIATGGDVDVARGAIAYATPLLPGWAGLPLRDIFEAAFENEQGAENHRVHEIRVDNDGNCAALAEAAFGAGRGFSHVLTLIVGTGIGAGYVVNGEVLRGAHGGALNPGQILLPGILLPGILMPGTRDTYESRIASGALSRRQGSSIQAIATHAAAQAELPPDLLDAAEQLGHLAAASAAILDPNCIVIAGSILLLGERFLSRAQQAFHQHARPPHQHLILRPSTLGADAGLIGAACLFRLPLG